MIPYKTSKEIGKAWAKEIERARTIDAPRWKPKELSCVSLYFRDPIFSAEEVISISVDARTIRAYRKNKKYEPLSIFRNWAWNELQDTGTLFKQLTSLSDDEFEEVHKSASERLSKFWDGVEQRTKMLSFGQRYKLVDLLFKMLIRWQRLPEAARQVMYRRAHVPLDKYSLIAIRTLWNETRSTRLTIPASASMGWVTSRWRYAAVQKFLALEMSKHNAAPIEFDILSWHLEMMDSNRFALKKRSKKTRGRGKNI